MLNEILQIITTFNLTVALVCCGISLYVLLKRRK